MSAQSVVLQVATTSTTTTAPHFSSPVACQVYQNGSAWAACQQFTGIFQPTWFWPILYGLTAGMGIFFAGYVFTKWHERLWGRKLEGYQGTIGVMQLPRGGGVLGKLTHFSERLWLFEPIKRKAQKILVSAMPGSVVQLDTREGGVSFALVSGDDRVSVNPDAAVWAEEKLGRLAKNHDWETFIFDWKLQELNSKEDGNGALVFPELSTLSRDTKVSIASPDSAGYVQKPVKDLSKDEKKWYMEQTKDEQDAILLKPEVKEVQQYKAKLKALVSRDDYYIWQGQKVPFELGERSDMATHLTAEFEQSDSDMAKATVGGRTINAKAIAGIVRGMPDASYVMALKADIEDMVRKSSKFTIKDIMPLAVLLIIASVCVVIITRVV